MLMIKWRYQWRQLAVGALARVITHLPRGKKGYDAGGQHALSRALSRFATGPQREGRSALVNNKNFWTSVRSNISHQLHSLSLSLSRSLLRSMLRSLLHSLLRSLVRSLSRSLLRSLFIGFFCHIWKSKYDNFFELIVILQIVIFCQL